MKKQRFTIEEIIRSLGELDLHCAWFDILRPKYKNKIGFDGDYRGNGDGPYLELTCYPEHIKFTSGTHLRPKEKNIRFVYNDYASIDSFTDILADFIIKYFKSIKLVRV